MLDLPQDNQIKTLRKYLKIKIQEDNVSFEGYSSQRDHVLTLLKKTIELDEAHSALVVGPRGSGKTTLINSILNQIEDDMDLSETYIIKLNGLLHHDDKISIKAITAQLKLENAVATRTFSTFAENLNFLINCLKSADSHKKIVCILDEFDMFCHSGLGQNLLYGLFDITHTKQAPLCVIGISSRLDVLELFEKRVKSRFSHRLIYLLDKKDNFLELFVKLLSIQKNEKNSDVSEKSSQKFDKRKRSNSSTESISTPKSTQKIKKIDPKNTPRSRRTTLIEKIDELTIIDENMIDNLESSSKKSSKKIRKHTESSEKSSEKMDIDSENANISNNFAIHKKVLQKCNFSEDILYEILDEVFIEKWNENILELSMTDDIDDGVEKFCYYTNNEQVFRDILFQVVSKLSKIKPTIDTEDFLNIIDKTVSLDHRVELIKSLSVLEISLLISMKHASEIFDGKPMNFEMVLHRYQKFANANSSTQNVPKPVILKGFEHLQALELIKPVRSVDCTEKTVTTNERTQKEYRFFVLAVPITDILQGIKNYKALPTEILHWAQSSVV